MFEFLRLHREIKKQAEEMKAEMIKLNESIAQLAAATKRLNEQWAEFDLPEFYTQEQIAAEAILKHAINN